MVIHISFVITIYSLRLLRGGADRVRALLSSSLWYLGAFPFDIDDSNTIEIRIFYIILNKLKNLMYKSIFYIINPVKDV